MKCQLSDLKKKNICTYISKKLWCCSRSVFMSLNFLKSGSGSKYGTPFWPRVEIYFHNERSRSYYKQSRFRYKR